MTKMTQKQFRKYLDRDESCWHCGATETVVPHHRVNRGMGGSKKREVPSNVIVMCSLFNGLMESQSNSALAAIQYGWKSPAYATPTEQPVYNMNDGCWYRLTDDYRKERLNEHRSDDSGVTPFKGVAGRETDSARDS